ncbi:hypothetical protein [Cetobacterium sp.]|uniref:hypothetical protein n=1 Tax=Cetobacterium sp. TaxID=2071632 RepID=UPI003F2C5875
MSESLRAIEKELQDKINKMVNVEKKVETHYLNGQIKEQGQLVKGKRHGVWKEYYENGNLKLKEQYITGGLNGTRKEYFEDGKMKSEFNFKNNKYNGYQKQYDNKGKLLIEGEYINDKLNGDVKYYENGELYLIEKYDEDKKIEEQKIRDIKEKGEEKLAEKKKKNEIEKLEDGKYKVELWHNETAFERAIYPNENINDYRPLERKIYENGKLYSETYFSYEKNEELSTVYNENGEKKLITVAKFNDGIRISDNYFEGTEQVNKREYLDINTFELEKQEIFNIEGKLLETSNWDEGELLSSKKYWMNGNLKEEKEQNNEEGYFKEKKYREDGSIEVEGTFNLEDEKHGKWKEYDINGNLKLEETYKDGKLDGVSKKIITLGGVIRDIQTTYENGDIKQQEEKEYDKNNKLAIKVVKDYQNNRIVFNETIQYKEEKEHFIERVKYEYDENNILRKEEKNIFEYDSNELEEILVGGYLRKYNEKEELLQDIPLSLEEEEPIIKREEALPIERTVYPKDGVKYFYFLEKQGESIDIYRTEHSLDNPDLLIKESNLENRVYVGAVESLEAGVELINQKYKDDREENYSKVFDNMKKALTPEDVQVAKELLKRLYPDDDLEKESKDYLKQNYSKVEGLYIRKEEKVKNENTVIKDYLENGVMYALLNNIDKTIEKAKLKMPVDLTDKEVTRVVKKDEKNNIKEVKILNKITGEIESEKILFYDKDNNLYRSHEFSNGVQRIKEYAKGVLNSEVIKDKENELKQKFNEKGELIEKTLVNLKMKNNKLTQKYENNVLTSETLNLGKRKSFFNVEYSKLFDKNGNILDEKYREGNTIKDIKDDVRNKINSVIDKIKTYAYIKFFGKELADIIVKHQEEKNKKSLNLEEIKLSNYVSTKNIAERFSKLAMVDTYYPNDVNKFKNVQSEKTYKENTLVNEEISQKGIRTVKEFKHKDNILVGEIYKEYKGQELLSKEEIDFENNKKSIKTFFKDGEIYLTKEKETKEDNNKKEFNYEKDTYYDSKTGNINKIVEVEIKDNNEKIKSQEFNNKGVLIEENNYLNDKLENRKIYVENRLDKEISIESGLKKQREYNLDETLKKEVITRGEEVKTEEFEYQDGKKAKSEVKLERNGELEVREIRSYQNEEIKFREQIRYEDGLEIKSKYNGSNNLIEQIRDNEIKTIEYYKNGELSEKGYDTYKETFKRDGELVREVTGSKIQKEGESEVTKLYEKGELKLEEIKYNKDFKLSNSVKKLYERGTVVKEEKREFSNGKEISYKEEVSSTTIKLVQKSQSQDTGIER